LDFDTSGIEDTETVTTATLSLYGNADGSATEFVSQARVDDWGPTLATGDWVAGESLSGLTLVATYNTASGWSTSAYNDYTSDAAFPANVPKTSVLYLVVTSDRLAAGTAPTGDETIDNYPAEDTGTTRDPKLVVVTTAAAVDQYPPLVMAQPIGSEVII
jgi:hypothetical protein